MTLRYLLDTSIVSSPISKTPNASILRRLDADGAACAIAAPVFNELVFGCQRLPRGKRRAALETFLHDVVLASFPVLAYDEPAARWHGIERARLEALRRTAPFVDGQIAAIAAIHELVLVTVNTRDFRPFKDIEIENWAERQVKRGTRS